MVSSLLERWGNLIYKTRWFVVIAWLALVAAVGGMYAGKLGPLLTGGGWGVPDSASYKAYKTISEKFASRSATSLTFVAKDHAHDVGSEAFSDHLRALQDALLQEESIAGVYSWLDAPDPLKDQFVGEAENVTFGFIEMNMDEGFAQKALPAIQDRLADTAASLGMEAAILGAPAMWGEVNKASQEGLR